MLNHVENKNYYFYSDLKPRLRLGAAALIWGRGSEPEPLLRSGAEAPARSRGSNLGPRLRLGAAPPI